MSNVVKKNISQPKKKKYRRPHIIKLEIGETKGGRTYHWKENPHFSRRPHYS